MIAILIAGCLLGFSVVLLYATRSFAFTPVRGAQENVQADHFQAQKPAPHRL